MADGFDKKRNSIEQYRDGKCNAMDSSEFWLNGALIDDHLYNTDIIQCFSDII